MKKVKLTARQFELEIHRLDSNLDFDSPTWNAAIVILSSLQEGGDPRHLASFLSLPVGVVRGFVAALRKNGMWSTKEGIQASGDYCEKGVGGVTFWLDVSVALGYLSRGSKAAA